MGRGRSHGGTSCERCCKVSVISCCYFLQLTEMTEGERGSKMKETWCKKNKILNQTMSNMVRGDILGAIPVRARRCYSLFIFFTGEILIADRRRCQINIIAQSLNPRGICAVRSWSDFGWNRAKSSPPTPQLLALQFCRIPAAIRAGSNAGWTAARKRRC